MFTSLWAVPAEKIPAGRYPGMFKAPLERSPASHCEDHCLRPDLKETFLPVHGRHDLLLTDIHDHGIQFILDI